MGRMYWRGAGAPAGREGRERERETKQEGRKEGRKGGQVDKGGIGCESTAFEVGSGDLSWFRMV